jgi:hypothetical protein
MKCYEVKSGATMWVFTDESVVAGKGEKRVAIGDEMFTEIVLDPIRVANGHALSPDLFIEGFPNKMLKAVERGYYVFYMDPYSDSEEMVAIHHHNLKLVGEEREQWRW